MYCVFRLCQINYYHTIPVQLIFLAMGKSDIMYTDHNCMGNIIFSKYKVYM